MDTVKVRFLKSWNGYDPGQEVNLHQPGLVEDLVGWGVVEIVRPAVVAEDRDDEADEVVRRPRGRKAKG